MPLLRAHTTSPRSVRAALVALALSLLPAAARAQVEVGESFIVDRADDTIVTGCTAAADDCTLRGALTRAGTGDIIIFDGTVFPLSDDPSVAPTTIAVTSALPVLSQSTLTLVGSEGRYPAVAIDGSLAPDGTDGLMITGPDAFVRGIEIRGFKGHGVVLEGARTTLGGTGGFNCGSVQRRMVIHGNGGWGVLVRGASAEGNSLQPMMVGTRTDGTPDGNGLGGVRIEAAAVSTFVSSHRCSTISFNHGPGLSIASPTTGMSGSQMPIQGNDSHGLLVEGVTDNGWSGFDLIENGGDGVRLVDVARFTLSSFSAQRNGGDGVHVLGAADVLLQQATITGNAGAGVRVVDGMRVRARRGSNADNGANAFDLVAPGDDASGITPNDGGADEDTGPNGLLDFPVIEAIDPAGLNVVAISGHACASCTVVLVRTDDPPGWGDFRGELGAVGADEEGHFSLTVSLGPGAPVSAFAIDPEGNQSELAANVRGPLQIVVDVADDGDAAACTAAEADCTLRAALALARRGDTIVFDGTAFPNGAMTSIALDAPLPPLTAGGVSISSVISTSGAPRVAIDGSAAGVDADGLVVASDGNLIEGIALIGFDRHGLVVEGDGNTLGRNTGCGRQASGIWALANGGWGILVRESADGDSLSNLQVGAADQGNGLGGMLLDRVTSGGLGSCTIFDSNLGPGLVVRQTQGIGLGSQLSASHNVFAGVWIDGASGLTLNANVSANVADGIVVSGGASDIGFGSLNVSGNGGAGLKVVDGQRVHANSSMFFSNNVKAAIDLVKAGDPFSGVTPNDPGDTDEGPNGLLDFPVIESIAPASPGVVDVSGSACPSCTVALVAASPDASGHGEPNGSAPRVQVDEAGHWSARVNLAAGGFLTAIAFDPDGNMSEAARNVQAPPRLVVDRSDDVVALGCAEATPNDCSLRGALTIARAGDAIAFDPEVFPPGGGTTIALTSPLPEIVAPRIGVNGGNPPGVVLEGSGAGAGANGLVVRSDEVSIVGLVIRGFAGDGLLVSGARNGFGSGGSCNASRPRLELYDNDGWGIHVTGPEADGNSFGFGYAGGVGESPLGNGLGGMRVDGGADGTGVSCLQVAANHGPGIAIVGASGASLSQLSVGGSVEAGNAGPGVLVESSSGVSIGGSIAANAGGGVRFVAASASSSTASFVDNLGDGVWVGGGSTDISLNSGTITRNSGAGVRVADGLRVGFGGNNGPSIVDNGALGIDLVGGNDNVFGVTYNDRGDLDLGPNRLQNFPDVRELVSRGDGNFDIRGVSCAGCLVRVYRQAIDPSGYGEAQTQLGRASADEFGVFTIRIALGLNLAAIRLTLTAQREGSVSEFGEGEEAEVLAQETAICGQNGVEDGEECDDGNTDSNDGCSSVCTLEGCGDGVTQPALGEVCDGNFCDDGDFCTVDDPCGAPDLEAGERCQCTSGAVRNCSDGDRCTVDSCSSEAGACLHEPVPCAEGDICDPADGQCKRCADTATRLNPDFGCAAPTPVCAIDVGAGTRACVACQVGNECASAVCEANACVPCAHTASTSDVDPGCSATLRVCDTTGAARTCIECAVDDDCLGPDDICVAGEGCVSCPRGDERLAEDTECNGEDDDCDGFVQDEIDEFPTEELACGKGVCAASFTTFCAPDGVPHVTCEPGEPTREEDDDCNGLDDDCDGPTDEERLPRTSLCGLGVCAAIGTERCVAGTLVDDCDPLSRPMLADTACNGRDDDCDGAVADESGEFVGVTLECGVGECARTITSRCLGGVVVDDQCTPGSPSPEVCDGVDNDCDGATDDGPGLALAVVPSRRALERDDVVVLTVFYAHAGAAPEALGALSFEARLPLGLAMRAAVGAEVDGSLVRVRRPGLAVGGAGSFALVLAPDGRGVGPWTIEVAATAPNLCRTSAASAPFTLVGPGLQLATRASSGDACGSVARQLTAWNSSDRAIDDVVIEDREPAAVRASVIGRGADLSGWPVVRWAVGRLGPGEAVTVGYRAGAEGAGGVAVHDAARALVAGVEVTRGNPTGALTSCPHPRVSVALGDGCGAAAVPVAITVDIDGALDGAVLRAWVGDCAAIDGLGAGTCSEGVASWALGRVAADRTLGLSLRGAGLGLVQAGVFAADTEPYASNLGATFFQGCDDGERCTADRCEVGACEHPVVALDGVADRCDGVDDDCDGATDEDHDALTVSCGLGVCAASGFTRCVEGRVVETCTPRAPASAIDDGCNGLDDDCDGATDEEFAAAPTSCGAGACHAVGERVCRDGAVVDSCAAEVGAGESCNGRDDDCDGVTDEDFVPADTRCGIGACTRTGRTGCRDGVLVDSCAPDAAGVERCNGEDDDCDGATDADDPDLELAPCSRQAGVCAGAMTTAELCRDGRFGECPDALYAARAAAQGLAFGASDDTCDGVDDDCSGRADEDTKSADTRCGVGICEGARGATTCVDGHLADSCDPRAGALAAELCNGLDDTCDGTTDEGFEEVGAPCDGDDPDQCPGGTLRCAADGSGVVCDDPGEVAVEACNGQDDDCDGATDEGCDADGDGVCAGACVAGVTACPDGCGDCDDGAAGVHPGASEVCGDGVDDDCDGATDDGCVEDFDGDGVADAEDDCPLTPDAAQADIDGDGIGDACDPSDDRDRTVIGGGGCGQGPAEAGAPGGSGGPGGIAALVIGAIVGIYAAIRRRARRRS